MPDKVMVGNVGLGLVSTSHLKGYKSHPKSEVVAVCDLDEERAKNFAETHGIPRYFTSYEEMIDTADINTVDIAVPTFMHAPIAVKATQSGKHVYCEKPFCRFLGEGTEAIQAAQHSGTLLTVGETYVFNTSHVRARQLIDDGEIGKPLQIRHRHGAWHARKDPAIPTGTPLSTSRHRLNSVMDRVNPADRMVFRVDHEDLPSRADTDSLGSIEASGASRSAVAGISFRAIAGNMLEGTFFERQLPDTVSFSQGDPECPLVKTECPGPKDRVAGRQLPVLGK